MGNQSRRNVFNGKAPYLVKNTSRPCATHSTVDSRFAGAVTTPFKRATWCFVVTQACGAIGRTSAYGNRPSSWVSRLGFVGRLGSSHRLSSATTWSVPVPIKTWCCVTPFAEYVAVRDVALGRTK